MGEKLSIDHYTIILMLTYINTSTYNDLTFKKHGKYFCLFPFKSLSHNHDYKQYISCLIKNILKMYVVPDHRYNYETIKIIQITLILILTIRNVVLIYNYKKRYIIVVYCYIIMFRACSIVSHVFYVIQQLQLAIHNEHDNTLSSVLEIKLLSTLNYIQNCSKVVTNTEPKEMWESPIHVYLFTLVNLLLFVYIISGTNMYTLNLPIGGQPIDLSYCKLYLHVCRTIIDILHGRCQCCAFVCYACVCFCFCCCACVIVVVCLVGVAHLSYGEVVKPVNTMIHAYIRFLQEKREKNSYILPIKLLSYGNNCRMYIYLSIMTIILKINNIYICQNSSYYIRNSYNMYRLFFMFCDDSYDCKDDNMLLICKYRKLNISENNVYTNKIQYEHYSLIPIEKWNNQILKCNNISNFLYICTLVLHIISILCAFISWSMYLLEHVLYFIYVLDIMYLLEMYLYTYADTVNTYSPYKSCSQLFWKASISSVCLYHLKIPNR